MLPGFSIIIASHNEGDWLARTIEGIYRFTHYPNYEIIVVADNCSDGSADFLKNKHYPSLSLDESEQSLGSARARNVGAARARGEFLVFIDSHSIPAQGDWLDELAVQLKDGRIGGATLKISSFENPDQVGYLYSIKDLLLEPVWLTPDRPANYQETPLIPGGCLAMRHELFRVIDGFDEGLKKWGREDAEISLRLWRLGYDLSVSHRATLAHYFKTGSRNFTISWDEVGYNILRSAATLFSPAWYDKVAANLATYYPAAYAKACKDLSADQSYQKRQQQLAQGFTRSFEDYLSHFQAALPLLQAAG